MSGLSLGCDTGFQDGRLNLTLTVQMVRNNIVATMQKLPLNLRAIGNSKGVVLPKTVLAQAGLEGASHVDMRVEHGEIVLSKPQVPVRQGWAEAAQRVAAVGDDALLMGEFGNEDDAGWVW
jgi:antitoxin MazE